MKTVIRNIINAEMKKHFAFHIHILCLSFAVPKHVCLLNCDNVGNVVVQL